MRRMTNDPGFHCDVLIVGAGLTGLVCADRLRRAGVTVQVLEKSRGAGGRMATRRTDAYRFDHGAQYFTARSPELKRQLEDWLGRGVAAAWDVPLAAFDGDAMRPVDNRGQRFVGTPGMNALARDLAEDVTCEFQCRVESVERGGGQWRIRAGGRQWTAGKLLLTTPPEQATQLLAGTGTCLGAELAQVDMRPCWAVMVAFESPAVFPWDGLFINRGPLSWASRMGSRPGRPEAEAWVLHAQPDWSTTHLESTTEAVESALLEAFGRVIGSVPGGSMPNRLLTISHRWRYALARDPLQVGCLVDESLGLVVAGAWCSGSRVEGAYLSGLAAARALNPAISP